MASTAGGLLDTFVARPYLLVLLAVVGVLMVAAHGRIRRRLRARGWARRGRRLIAHGVAAIGLVMILIAAGYLVPVGIMIHGAR